MSSRQREVYDAIVAGPRGKVEGPLIVWLASPELAERAQALGEFCRFNSTLEPRLSELAILVVAAHWRAGFEWHVHAPVALTAGVSSSAIEAIRTGRDPILNRPDEQAVYDISRELMVIRNLSESTYQKYRLILGEKQMVDLVGVVGYYTFVAISINAFDVEIPDGSVNPFDHQ